MFPRKLRTDKCPACTCKIDSYSVLTRKENSQIDLQGSDFETKIDLWFNSGHEASFSDLLESTTAQNTGSGKKDNLHEDGLVADCLDHSYFQEELKQLLALHG